MRAVKGINALNCGAPVAVFDMNCRDAHRAAIMGGDRILQGAIDRLFQIGLGGGEVLAGVLNPVALGRNLVARAIGVGLGAVQGVIRIGLRIGGLLAGDRVALAFQLGLGAA